MIFNKNSKELLYKKIQAAKYSSLYINYLKN